MVCVSKAKKKKIAFRFLVLRLYGTITQRENKTDTDLGWSFVTRKKIYTSVTTWRIRLILWGEKKKVKAIRYGRRGRVEHRTMMD